MFSLSITILLPKCKHFYFMALMISCLTLLTLLQKELLR